MIWTHLTTLDEEIRCIWHNNAGVTLNKVLFVGVRYFTTIAFGFVLDQSEFPRFLTHTTLGFTASVSYNKFVPISSARLTGD